MVFKSRVATNWGFKACCLPCGGLSHRWVPLPRIRFDPDRPVLLNWPGGFGSVYVFSVPPSKDEAENQSGQEDAERPERDEPEDSSCHFSTFFLFCCNYLFPITEHDFDRVL